jgi:hypothetical protein
MTTSEDRACCLFFSHATGLEQLAHTSSPQPLLDAVDLVPFLAALADPRSRRGRRFPFTALVAAAAAGALAGARSVTAIAEWISDALAGYCWPSTPPRPLHQGGHHATSHHRHAAPQPPGR